MKRYIGIIALLGAALLSGGNSGVHYGEDYLPPVPQKDKGKDKPKGTDWYYFDTEGNFVTSLDYVYKCYAINEKNAQKKFEKWKEAYLKS